MPLLETLAAAGASGLVGLGQNALNRANAKRSAQKQYEYQKKLIALQNEYNLSNWNAEAAYNSVGAQMSRMRAAGLNTNLIYGSGADGGIVSSAPEVDSGSIDYSIQDPNLSGAINSGLSVYRAAAELENIESVTELNKMKTLSEMYDGAIKAKDFEYADLIKQVSLDLMGSQAAKNYSDINVNEANIAKINADTTFRNLVNQYYPEVTGQSLAESRSRLQLNGQQMRELQSKIRVNNKLTAKMDIEIDKLLAEIDYIASKTDLTDAEFLESRKRCSEIDARIRKLGAEADFTEMETDYYIWNHPRTSSAFGVRWNNSSSSGRNRDKLSPYISDEELLMFVRERYGEKAASMLEK